MKRSEINANIRKAKELFASLNFLLPKWAFWSPVDWEKAGLQAYEIKECMLGWDITDFSSGDFAKVGLTLFTIRNGNLADPMNEKRYGEKIMLVQPMQITPMHFHFSKMEDIINRGGGKLVIELYNSMPDELLDERSDVAVRSREGLRERSGLLRGKAIEGPITILENGLSFEVDVAGGQKTGFYLDQRDNRQILRAIVKRYVRFQTPPRLLNVFSYTGGFSVYGLSAGAAAVINVDTSEDALAAVCRNLQLNNLDSSRSENINGNAFQVLRKLRQNGA